MYSKDDDIIKDAVSRGVHFNENNELIGYKNKKIKAKPGDDGYPTYYVRYNGKTRKIRIHRLKAYFLFGDRIFEPTLEVRHLNGNKLDISDNNITIGTAADNYLDKPQSIRVKVAEAGASKVRKFSKEQIESIRKQHSEGLTYKELIERYGSCKATISYIINKKTYQ
jgi:hypothetical protein